jgi:hypothetical protein
MTRFKTKRALLKHSSEMHKTHRTRLKILETRRRSMGRNWHAEEDEALIRLVEIHGKQWGIIASQMENRSPAQVAARWEKCLDPKLTKGPFTPEEDQIIIDYVEQNGAQNWPGLSEFLVRRSAKQCRERWLNHLDPGVSSIPWTAEEDMLIFDNYSRIGAKWSLIARVLPGRTDNAIKNRWNSSISKRIQSDASGRRILGPDYSRRPRVPVKPPTGRPPPIRTLPGPTPAIQTMPPIAGGNAVGLPATNDMLPFAPSSPFADEPRILSPFSNPPGTMSPFGTFRSPTTPQSLFPLTSSGTSTPFPWDRPNGFR